MQSIKVRDYMHHRPVSFKAGMSIVEAAERLLNAHQGGGPVVDEQGRVIGFLSERDCLSIMLKDTYQNESHYLITDIMTSPAQTVTPETSILDIAQRLLSEAPTIYPVVDDNNFLLGVITRSDVLTAIDKHLNAMYEKGHRRFV